MDKQQGHAWLIIGMGGVALIIGAPAHAQESPAAVNACFARDVHASKASVLIIGDSTNNPRGAVGFVPYYEGFLQAMPAEIEVCGFRVSGSTGSTGVNGYIRFVGGATAQMVDNGIAPRTQDVPVAFSPHAPPGYRNEFQLLQNGQLPSGTRFAAVGFVDLEGIYPHAAEWAEDATLVIRTPFFTAGDGSILDSISMTPLTDHQGKAGNSVAGFEHGTAVDVQLSSLGYGLQNIDAEFVDPPSTRIGVSFGGDLDDDDAGEAGKSLAWCDHVVFDRVLAQADRGIYFDSVSIGGYTAQDHADSLDPEIFDDYFAVAPRPINTVLIWLGQNAELDEWNGMLQPAWGERIEAIGDSAIEAAVASGSPSVPNIVLCTPPLAGGPYPGNRFSAMNAALAEIANRRGWGHLDLQTLVGDAMSTIDPGLIGPGPHPSQSGAVYLADLIYEHLRCLRAEFTGDSARDFFDMSAFLQLYLQEDSRADLNGDGAFNFFDIADFLAAFSMDCR